MFRNGQWVKFEPAIAVGAAVLLGDEAVIVDEALLAQITPLIPRMRVAGDGRHVGIFIKGGRFQDGKGGFRQMPDSVAPQLQVLGPNGEQNVQMIWKGRVVTLLLTASAFAQPGPLLDREDLPTYRDETSHPDWKPAA